MSLQIYAVFVLKKKSSADVDSLFTNITYLQNSLLAKFLMLDSVYSRMEQVKFVKDRLQRT